MNKKKRSFKWHSYFRLVLSMFICTFSAAVLTGLISYILSLYEINTRRPAIINIIISLLACTIIATIIQSMTSRQISNYIAQTRSCFERLSKGDFSEEITLDSKHPNPALQKVIDDINQVIRELNSITLIKKDFITNFSHEFKTPIASIQGFAELLCNDPNLSEEEKQKYYQIIRDESMRLSNLSNMTLLLSKLNSDSIVLDKETIYIDESIEETLLLFYKAFEEKKIEIEVNLQHFRCSASRELVKELWINLINNAIKYTPEGGKIRLTSSRIENGFLISIKDNGIGMSEEMQKHIFDEYFHGNPSRTNHGIGLGLSIVKKIIELHDWKIYVNSQENQGSTFSILIPSEPESN